MGSLLLMVLLGVPIHRVGIYRRQGVQTGNDSGRPGRLQIDSCRMTHFYFWVVKLGNQGGNPFGVTCPVGGFLHAGFGELTRTCKLWGSRHQVVPRPLKSRESQKLSATKTGDKPDTLVGSQWTLQQGGQ